MPHTKTQIRTHAHPGVYTGTHTLSLSVQPGTVQFISAFGQRLKEKLPFQQLRATTLLTVPRPRTRLRLPLLHAFCFLLPASVCCLLLSAVCCCLFTLCSLENVHIFRHVCHVSLHWLVCLLLPPSPPFALLYLFLHVCVCIFLTPIAFNTSNTHTQTGHTHARVT